MAGNDDTEAAGRTCQPMSGTLLAFRKVWRASLSDCARRTKQRHCSQAHVTISGVICTPLAVRFPGFQQGHGFVVLHTHNIRPQCQHLWQSITWTQAPPGTVHVGGSAACPQLSLLSMLELCHNHFNPCHCHSSGQRLPRLTSAAFASLCYHILCIVGQAS